MPHFIRLAALSELPAEGEAKEFLCKSEDGEKVICVANVNGVISAMDNVCLHRGGPLGQGIIEGNKVVCPWHGWQFDPQTGEATHNPKAKVAVYPIKIENEEVMVELLPEPE
ncbi:MAG: Rieske (2Fe-2S) protein [Terriglobales bacterium]|jgi:nitrite reductase (NADH) small subunit